MTKYSKADLTPANADRLYRLLTNPDAIREHVVARVVRAFRWWLAEGKFRNITADELKDEIDALEAAAISEISNTDLADWIRAQRVRLADHGQGTAPWSDEPKKLWLVLRGLTGDRVVDVRNLHRDDAVLPGALFHVGAFCAWDGDPLGGSDHMHFDPKLEPEQFGLICMRSRAWTGTAGLPVKTPAGRTKRVRGYNSGVWHLYKLLATKGSHSAEWRASMRAAGWPEVAKDYETRYASTRRAAEKKAS